MKPGFFSRSPMGRCLWTFRREFAWVAVFSLFANLMALTPTLYMLQVFDRVMISGNELTLLALTLLAVFFFLVMGFAEWLRSRLLVRAGARFDEAINTLVFRASFVHSLAQRSRNPQLAFADLTAVRQFLTGQGVFAVMDLPWTAVYVAILFLMHPWLGWAAMIFMVPMSVLAWLAYRVTAEPARRAQDAARDTNAFVFAKLRNAETVEALGMVGHLRRLWLGLYERQLSVHGDAMERSQRITALTKFVQYTQQSLILAVGALLVMEGKIGVGAMIASNALITNALRPFGTLVSTWKGFAEARHAYGRLESLLQSQEDAEAAAPITGAIRGQITLRRLSATAPGREKPILDQLDAEFSAGEVVAIVGPSGAGKSTLARCLLGIWPHTSGEVLLDGRPLRDMARDSLGPQVGYLPQDIEIFDGTIAENIARYGAPEPDHVIAAATRTGIHDMVLRLPKGYDTPMGEAGALLSAGQRQRVGLARAIYGEPELIVLDEPNASLDDAGEAALVKAVRELRARGRTVFMIVHQRHILAAADRVVVMEAGRIKTIAPVVVQRAQPQLEKQT
jgi:ATP-binding cassette subfamily C exporter for protease/lipase